MLELDLLYLAYRFSLVRANVLRNLGRVPFIDVSIQKGSQIALPRWLAEHLAKDGFVELEEGLVSPKQISQIAFMQSRKSRELMKISEFFYIHAIESLRELENKARSSSDLMLLQAVDKAKTSISNIAKVRLNIILRAILLEGVNTIKNNLTMEESVLANTISRMLDEWKSRFVVP